MCIHQVLDPIERLIDRPLGDLDDILAVHGYAQGFLAQAFSMTFRARFEGDEPPDLGSDPLGICILVAPHHIADHPFEWGAEGAASATASDILNPYLFSLGSIEQKVQLRLI